MTHDSPEPPLKLPQRESDAHKGSFGRVLLIGGSRGMAGSIALSSIAALHTGSGLVTAVVPDRCLDTVASFHPAIMTTPLADDSDGRFATDAAGELCKWMAAANVVACGPGMTTAAGSMAIVERVLQSSKTPVVFDADAINCLAMLDWTTQVRNQASATAEASLVLTPHPGEFARLTGVSSADRRSQRDAAIELSKASGAVIVLKGAPTMVIEGDAVWTNSTGNPGMATAGSGDVLTGVIASLIGQSLSVGDAARLGVWLHGRAGDLVASQMGQAGVTAPAISSMISLAIDEVLAD